jgi:hypothetical protein
MAFLGWLMGYGTVVWNESKLSFFLTTVSNRLIVYLPLCESELGEYRLCLLRKCIAVHFACHILHAPRSELVDCFSKSVQSFVFQLLSGLVVFSHEIYILYVYTIVNSYPAIVYVHLWPLFAQYTA